MRRVVRPVGALGVVVGAQERQQSLRRLPHFGVGLAGRVVGLVVLARRRELAPARRPCRRAAAAGVAGAFAVLNGSRAVPANGALIITTRWNTSGRVSAHHAATGDPKSWPTTPASVRWPSAEVSASRSRTRLKRRERRQVVVEVHVGAAAAAVAALVGRHHVEAGLGQRQHHLAPAVGELREAVDQQQPGPAAALVAGLEHVHRDAVHAGDDPRADARGQRAGAERPGRRRLRGDAARRSRRRRPAGAAARPRIHRRRVRFGMIRSASIGV